jgi:hypothetical protein
MRAGVSAPGYSCVIEDAGLPVSKIASKLRRAWMGDRAVYCARLESVCAFTGTRGSNPRPSATLLSMSRSKTDQLPARY